MPTFTKRHRLPRAFLGLAFGVFALGIAPSITAASTISPPDQPDTGNGQSLPEVTVIGKMDKHTLNHLVNQFIESHAKPSAVISQLGRWHQDICPNITGLQRAYGQFISERITSVARSVGAPTRAEGKKCAANVEVLFTREPQAMLDQIASKYRPLLGSYSITEVKEATTFTHPVQAWYETGSRSLDYLPPRKMPLAGGDVPAGDTPPPPLAYGSGESPFITGMQIDSGDSGSDLSSTSGTAGSYFTHGLRSEFVHVLIIVDAKKVTEYQLQSVSDYIALLTLTHIASLDTCSQLLSILNLFAKDCASRPSRMTVSDTAYLKALYKADLDMNLNIEQGDLHVRMLDGISKK